MGGVATVEFEKQLEIGQIGEGLIASWLRRRGWAVLPVYDIEIETGKGPRLFMPSTQLIAPDMLVFRGEVSMWIEAKHKSRFSWYGRGKTFCTGIDYKHFRHYCKVDDESPFPVWLLFLHRLSDTWEQDVRRWDAPKECPTGLYGNTLKKLRNSFRLGDRPSVGTRGLVYWNEDQLIKMADLNDVISL